MRTGSHRGIRCHTPSRRIARLISSQPWGRSKRREISMRLLWKRISSRSFQSHYFRFVVWRNPARKLVQASVILRASRYTVTWRSAGKPSFSWLYSCQQLMQRISVNHEKQLRVLLHAYCCTVSSHETNARPLKSGT